MRRVILLELAALLLMLGVPRVAAADRGVDVFTHADVGAALIDEDPFLLLSLEQHFLSDRFELVLRGPLRLGLATDSSSNDAGLRAEDWDDPSDFARIVPRLAFQFPLSDGHVKFLFGEINGAGLGLGTLVDAYYNSIDMDLYQGGVVAGASWRGNGFELILDNVVEPSILFGRLFAAPFSWFLDHRAARRVELGLTVGADIFAPRRLTATDATAVAAGALDLSAVLLQYDVFSLVPYVAFGLLDGDMGTHAGLSTTLRPTGEAGWEFHLKGEYRYSGPDYHPSFVNPFYEYRRYHYLSDADSLSTTPTFADALAEEDLASAHGFMVDGSAQLGQRIRIGARYDREGRDRPHWILARGSFEPNDQWMIACFYGGDHTSGGNPFNADALFGAEVRGQVIGPFTFFASFFRRKRNIEENASAANEMGLGLGITAIY